MTICKVYLYPQNHPVSKKNLKDKNLIQITNMDTIHYRTIDKYIISHPVRWIFSNYFLYAPNLPFLEDFH